MAERPWQRDRGREREREVGKETLAERRWQRDVDRETLAERRWQRDVGRETVAETVAEIPWQRYRGRGRGNQAELWRP